MQAAALGPTDSPFPAVTVTPQEFPQLAGADRAILGNLAKRKPSITAATQGFCHRFHTSFSQCYFIA
jgi:hypothetical protein